jgi:choline-sulfatase
MKFALISKHHTLFYTMYEKSKSLSVQPNILVIMSDQHSPHLVGCYGNGLVRTPNLDRLAAEGMRFDNAYCPSPLCVPSRMSFMSGRTPSRNRVWCNAGSLSSAIPCWTHYLGNAGYETALIGRMHFVGQDQRHGFIKRPIGEISLPINSWGIREKGNSQQRSAPLVAGKGVNPYQWYDDRVVEGLQTYLDEQGEKKTGQPFAAVAGFLLPHNPYIAPEELFDYYYERIDVPLDILENEPPMITHHKEVHGFSKPLHPDQIRRARAAYFALCEYFDSIVGKIMDCLEKSGLAENTIVVYVSDHGDMAGEKGCWTKSCFYEGSVGVPMIIKVPGVTKSGSVSDAVVNLYDLPPTLCELAGAEPMRHVDGHSMVPLLRGDSSGWNNETFSEISNNLDNAAICMLRSDDWKLWIHSERNIPPALFNLKDDPDENIDLAQDPRYTEKVDELSAKVHSFWTPDTVVKEAMVSRDDYKTISKCDSPHQTELDETSWSPIFPLELDSKYQPPVGN